MDRETGKLEEGGSVLVGKDKRRRIGALLGFKDNLYLDGVEMEETSITASQRTRLGIKWKCEIYQCKNATFFVKGRMGYREDGVIMVGL